ncbi:MAG: macB 1 [Verrucomicrobiales bacterium]|nr:macB 1 [Verrucomicrobiales bacterium]
MRLGGLYDKQRNDRELDEEVESHLQLHLEDNLRLGMTAEEARRQAVIRLGGIESTKEAYRDQRGLPWSEMLWQDLRYAARQLRKNPVFTTVAVLTLALGIGVNTTIFNLINAVVWRSLPGVSRIEELVSFDYLDASGTRALALSYADYLDFSNLTNVLEGIVAAGVQSAEVDAGNGSTDGLVGLVTGDYFRVLGVRAAAGRFFDAREGLHRGADAIAVLSHDYWRRHFGGTPSIIGQTIRINHRVFTIVGVAEKNFRGDTLDRSPDLWIPLNMIDEVQPIYARLGHDLLARGQDWLRLRARLRPGANIPAAASAVQMRSREIERSHRDVNQGRTVTLAPLEQSVRGEMALMAERGFYVQALSGLFLLLACANLTNLLLARAHKRRLEIGVRLALGASRGRLLRQLFTENLLLSSMGGTAALILSYWTTRLIGIAIKSFNAISFYQLDFNLDYDGRVIGFILLLTVLAGLVIGFLSAPKAAEFDDGLALKSNLAGPNKFGRISTLWILAMGQIAAAVVLLAMAGLCVKSLHNALAINLGFDPRPLLSLFLDVPSLGKSSDTERQILSQILEKIQSSPGIKSAALAQHRPLGFTGRKIYGDIEMRSRTASSHNGLARRFSAYANTVSSDYFRTVGIPIVQGRGFGREAPNGIRVAIVNETLARDKWPGENPVGKRVCVTSYQKGTPLPGGVRPAPIWAEIIGVAKDSKYHGLVEDPTDYLYWSADQVYPGAMHLMVRCEGLASSGIPAVRQALRELAPDLNSSNLQTMESHLDYRYFFPRRAAGFISGISVLGLLLAALGLYGVLSCTVAQRVKEFAIRMALGANRRDVLQQVLTEGLVLTGLGVVTGSVATAGIVRLIRGYLYGVGGLEMSVFLGVAAVLSVASLAASVIPAYRGMKTDPMVALRYE